METLWMDVRNFQFEYCLMQTRSACNGASKKTVNTELTSFSDFSNKLNVFHLNLSHSLNIYKQ